MIACDHKRLIEGTLGRGVKKPNEQPSISVLLCASKNKEVVGYAISQVMSTPLVAEYETHLPDERLPHEIPGTKFRGERGRTGRRTGTQLVTLWHTSTGPIRLVKLTASPFLRSLWHTSTGPIRLVKLTASPFLRSLLVRFPAGSRMR